MARIRSVKPELRTSEVVASWPVEIRYFFVLLWGYLDDKGRGLDVPKAISGDCFPHDDRITPAKINGWLHKMANTKIAPDKGPPICRYEADGRRYLHCVNWDEHQRINRPSPSRHPPCPLHEGLTESLTTGSVSGSLPGAAEQQSRGAEEQQQPVSEPLTERLRAAAAIIIDSTGATPVEALALARWIDRERRPKNLPGLVKTLSRGPDLAAMLTDQRNRETAAATAATIGQAKYDPPCEHGQPGGSNVHPATGEPLCPLCRRSANLP